MTKSQEVRHVSCNQVFTQSWSERYFKTVSIYCEICAVNGPEIMKMWKINGSVFQR